MTRVANYELKENTVCPNNTQQGIRSPSDQKLYRAYFSLVFFPISSFYLENWQNCQFMAFFFSRICLRSPTTNPHPPAPRNIVILQGFFFYYYFASFSVVQCAKCLVFGFTKCFSPVRLDTLCGRVEPLSWDSKLRP